MKLLDLPFLKLVSGILLLWIAFDLLRREGQDRKVEAAGSIGAAVRTIVLADIIMSLDNIVAVAAAAKGSIALIVFGIALSVPLIVFGSTLVLRLLKRFPILVVAGAALLGWVAGEIAASDPFVEAHLGPASTTGRWFELAFTAVVAVAALALHVLRRRRKLNA